MRNLSTRGSNSAQRLSLRAARPRPAESRRGVLLLVVLSLLVLFAMIAVTFVLIAGQYRRSSRASGRAEQYSNNPSRQLDDVFAQVVRDVWVRPTPGGTRPGTVLRGHSLLNDMYGQDYTKGTISSPSAQKVTGSPFFDFQSTDVAPPPPIGTRYPLASQLYTPGFCNGCVLTMVDGPMANVSMRIVGWAYNTAPPPTGTYTIRVLPLDVPSSQMLTAFQSNASGNPFIINGRPFNGTGFGYDPTSSFSAPSMLSARYPAFGPNFEYQVLLPNPKYFQSDTSNYPEFGGTGGADEDYDAPDLQNMLLSYIPLAPADSSSILPSLHRPELINYFVTTKSAPSWRALPADLLRKIMLRPSPLDHPGFTGSNLQFEADGKASPVNPFPRWDVDNDSDGIADSVWVDVGFPVQTMPDGRRMKPLAAILVRDLDGRLNVNAHGNIAQAWDNYKLYDTPGALGIPINSGSPVTLADCLVNPAPLPSVKDLPRGSGYGPAEINLQAGGLFTTATDYRNFFNPSSNYEGRYGEFGKAALPAMPMPGNSVPLASSGADDVLNRIRHYDLPANFNYYTMPSIYGSPSDLWGCAVLGVDYAGQPVYSFAQATGADYNLGFAHDEAPHDPYAFNLSRSRVRGNTSFPTPGDNPFSPGELERILRPFDTDSSGLPDRLRGLLGSSLPVGQLRNLVTTDSWDLPTPAIVPTRDMAMLLQAQSTIPGLPLPLPTSNLHLTDLLRAKMLESLIISKGSLPTGTGYIPPPPISPAEIDNINKQVVQMLPPEVIAGQRFDLNRPFGNGVDDNGNNVIDEPFENGANSEQVASWGSYVGGPFPLDLNNDGATDPNTPLPAPPIGMPDSLSRQQYAKYLYIMMMLLVERDEAATYAWSEATENLNPTQRRELTARRMAQWAVNVVDFRDADSIMTPFEYDVDPFNVTTSNPNGWNVDGDHTTVDVSADRRVVWGCEYPDLMLTEVLAFHDRRVEDFLDDNGVNNDRNKNRPGPTQDFTLDQKRIPEGSLFVELYCPQVANASASLTRSPDLYSIHGGVSKLDLLRLRRRIQ